MTRKDKTKKEKDHQKTSNADWKSGLLSGPTPFVFEEDRKLLETLALQSRYLSGLFKV